MHLIMLHFVCFTINCFKKFFKIAVWFWNICTKHAVFCIFLLLCLLLAIEHTYVEIIQQKMGVPPVPGPMPWVGPSVQASREENAHKQFSLCLRARASDYCRDLQGFGSRCMYVRKFMTPQKSHESVNSQSLKNELTVLTSQSANCNKNCIFSDENLWCLMCFLSFLLFLGVCLQVTTLKRTTWRMGVQSAVHTTTRYNDTNCKCVFFLSIKMIQF